MHSAFFRFWVPAILMFGLHRGIAHAAPVISEVLWAGSDLSSSDEWVEITATDVESSLTGFTLTSVNTSGTEVTIARFSDGMTAGPGRFLVVSRFGAAQSRLLTEPALISGDISLPNTKLLLRLRDSTGTIVDEVDDGVGSPFAGASVSDKKISMTRVDLRAKGNEAANWISTNIKAGLDEGTIVLATPGFDISGSGIPLEPYTEPKITFSSDSSHSSISSYSSLSSPSCPDPRIIVQSGTTSGVEKVTLNIQILTEGKSLASGSCQILFGDGERSDSCNPPSHTYEEPGTYALRAILPNYCGTTVERILPIHVLEKTSSSSKSSSSIVPDLDPTLAVFREESFQILALLPNPSGRHSEWIEIVNMRGQVADLEGWKLVLPRSGKTFTFGSVPFGIGETKRLLAHDLNLSFPNGGGEVQLWNRAGDVYSSLQWQATESDTVVSNQKADLQAISAIVTHVIDGETLDVRIDPAITVPGIRSVERVRLLGVHAPEVRDDDRSKSPIGIRSLVFVSDLLVNKIVELEFDSIIRDSEGKLLAYVKTEEGFLLQNLLLSRGLVMRTDDVLLRSKEMSDAQAEAMETFAGLWSMQSSQPSVVSVSSSSVPPRRISFFTPFVATVDFSSSVSSSLPSVIVVKAAPRSAGSGQAKKPQAEKKFPPVMIASSSSQNMLADSGLVVIPAMSVMTGATLFRRPSSVGLVQPQFLIGFALAMAGFVSVFLFMRKR